MAKISKIAKNERRKALVAKYAERRRELKEIIRNPKSTPAERQHAQLKLQSLTRDASPTRITNRCAATGRPRAVYRAFGLSRIAFRERALRGELPGVRKASW